MSHCSDNENDRDAKRSLILVKLLHAEYTHAYSTNRGRALLTFSCSTHTPMCVKHCILSTFPSPVKTKSRACYSGGIRTHDPCNSRAVLTHRCMDKKKINIVYPRCKFNISCILVFVLIVEACATRPLLPSYYIEKQTYSKPLFRKFECWGVFKLVL